MRKYAFAFLFLLFLCPAQSKASVYEQNNYCYNYVASFGSSASLSCIFPTAVNSGKVVVTGHASDLTSFTTSCTETCVCPSPATQTFNLSGFIHQEFICYADITTTHSTFTFTITATVGGARSLMLEGFQVTGLGSGDDGAAGANNANTTNITTTGNNEYIFSTCNTTNVSEPFATGSNFQVGKIAPSDVNNIVNIDMGQNAATTGTYTASCSNGGSGGVVTEVAAIAFTTSGGSVPAVHIVQRCFVAGIASGGGCGLSNVSSSNKLLYNFYGQTIAQLSPATGSPVCPANSYVTHNYGGVNFSTGMCYKDGASGNFGATASCGGCNVLAVTEIEIAGLNTGIDTGSETGLAATSGTFTAAASNEWAMYSAQDNAANPMTPASGFTYIGTWFTFSGCCNGGTQQFMLALEPNVPSGSNSVSYSLTGSTTPVMTVSAFVQSATAFVGTHQIISAKNQTEQEPDGLISVQ